MLGYDPNKKLRKESSRYHKGEFEKENEKPG
jgi:hypothetical protein